MVDNKAHWERIYQKRSPQQLGWYEETPTNSLQLIRNSGILKHDAILDVGGGASTLVDSLHHAGYSNLSVMDISRNALRLVQARLAPQSRTIQWIEADVTQFTSQRKYSLWHDRAAFHFLVDPDQRSAYVDVLKSTLAPDGQVIIASFAIGGPTQCSGRETVQYDTKKLVAVFGSDFDLVENLEATHVQPSGAEQAYEYFRLVRKT